MLAYNYTFLDFADILSVSGRLSEQGMSGLLFVIVTISMILIMSFVVIPIVIFTLRKREIKKQKRNKKNLLTEILLKKELEDEIEKEIVIDKNTP